MIHNTPNLENLKLPPENKLEPLSKDSKVQYNIRINDRWYSFRLRRARRV
ncbi:toxin-antitoxin system, toxin component [Leptospira santarosai]